MEALQGVARGSVSSKVVGASDAEAHQDRFEALMQKTLRLPETELGEWAYKKNQAYQSNASLLPGLRGEVSDPLAVMKATQHLMVANLEMEIGAKLVGSLGQAVNRLVSIQ